MNRRPAIKTMSLIKGVICVAWVLLFALLLHRDSFVKTINSRESAILEQARRTEYQGIYFKDKKIGYVQHHGAPADDNTLVVSQRAIMDLNISGQSHPIDLDLRATIDQNSRLRDFRFNFSSPFYRMEAVGTVSGSTVSFRLDTGNSIIEDQIDLSDPPLLPTSRRAYLLSQDLAIGEKIRVPWFDPLSLTGKTSLVEYRGREKTLINQRVYPLHRFTELFAGVRVNVWLDDDGVVVKEESPAGFVFIREPEFKAKMHDGRSQDLLAGVSIGISGTLPDLSAREVMRYRLRLPEEGDFDLSSGRQSFVDPILIVRREQLPSDSAAETEPCAAADRELQASPYIQADAEEIIALSREITSELASPLARASALADWVYHNLEKRPVIGIPDALSTLKTGIGDCNEHASLFAALARAAGIPTKIAVGVVWQHDAFYYHAWNEVCLDGTWISLDTTTNQLPADLTHLKFVEGELQEQMRIGALLNNLQIEPLND
jgi:hypothetical protein